MVISRYGMQMESSVCIILLELRCFYKEIWRGDMDHSNTDFFSKNGNTGSFPSPQRIKDKFCFFVIVTHYLELEGAF